MASTIKTNAEIGFPKAGRFSADEQVAMHDILAAFLRESSVDFVDRTDFTNGNKVWALVACRQATVTVDPNYGLKLSKSDSAGKPTFTSEERASLQPIIDRLNAALESAPVGGMSPEEKSNWSKSGYETTVNVVNWKK